MKRLLVIASALVGVLLNGIGCKQATEPSATPVYIMFDSVSYAVTMPGVNLITQYHYSKPVDTVVYHDSTAFQFSSIQEPFITLTPADGENDNTIHMRFDVIDTNRLPSYALNVDAIDLALDTSHHVASLDYHYYATSLDGFTGDETTDTIIYTLSGVPCYDSSGYCIISAAGETLLGALKQFRAWQGTYVHPANAPRVYTTAEFLNVLPEKRSAASIRLVLHKFVPKV